MSSIPASSAAPPLANEALTAQSKPKNAAEAAKQFEAMLIAQMLRAAHESNADSRDGGDSGSDTLFDVAGQQFAQVLANNGGLGLAKTILQGLQPK
jgi:Rod binding domain-containing protein